MTILAIDTSTDYLSLAVMRGGKIVARFHRRSHMRHSSLLVPTIDRLLKKVRMKLSGIDSFAISIGPGSFTGLRIAVATIKGLAFALDKPIVTIPTLDVVAQNAKSFKGIICPVLDARKNKVYACLYESDGKTVKRITEYLLLPAKELMEKAARYDKIFFLGDALHLIGRVDSKKVDWHPKADVVAKLGAEYCKNKKFVTAEKLEPMYLYSRECDITGK
ncbi:MAG: tRNA (adenosine(37)-N6)-threonylcarbamoyltransferase complex dimerization subunit type 1 TsaB [Candidatus Omnitrophota bacterium]